MTDLGLNVAISLLPSGDIGVWLCLRLWPASGTEKSVGRDCTEKATQQLPQLDDQTTTRRPMS